MQPVLSEALYFVGQRGTLAGRSRIGLTDMGAYPLLLMSRPNGIRELVESRLALAGVRPQLAAEINAPALLMEAVKAGIGFAVLPACGLEDSRQAGTVDALELEEGALRRTVFIGTSRLSSLSLAAEHVCAILKQVMTTSVKEGRWNACLHTPDVNE